MDNVQAIAVVIGIVNGVRLLKENDRWGFLFFLIALAVGLGMGLLHWFGLTLETGLIVALASSGLYRVAQVV